MQRFVLMAILLSMGAPALASAAEQPDWYRCESDAQCVIADWTCGQVKSVNQSMVDAFKERAQQTQQRIRCRWSYLENREQLKAVCITNVCAITPDPIYGYKR